MIGNIPSVFGSVVRDFSQNVAPTGFNEVKAKVANDAANVFYAQAAKDVVADSVYNSQGQAPTVDVKIGRILNTIA
ncbi:MAG: hypothetical protein PHH16_00990 [Candidatus Gracilibacteria bacterium]|nr:hypothetical protein [Candidatus Gracilibacteria bacterium]